MNYFEFYGIAVSFRPDPAAVKKKYYELSRAFHPDRFTLANAAAQEEAIEKSMLNNEAYKVLSDADRTMQYILRTKGLLGEEETKLALPKDFLMDMMDINERIMDLQMDDDPASLETVKTDVENLRKQLLEDVAPVLESYTDTPEHEKSLEQVKYFYLKMKYLLRIQKSLATFAPL
jgi:molecular chaperone HscB